MPTIDFGYEGQPNAGSGTDSKGTNTDSKTDITTGENVQLDEHGNPIAAIDNTPTPIPDDNEGEVKADDKGDKAPENKEEKPAALEPGTSIELDGESYLVDPVGNLVDKDGNIFKKAEEVADFIAQFEAEEVAADEKKVDIASIQKAIGIEVVDDKGKKIKFDDSPEGVVAYVDSVIQAREEEIREATVNRLYQEVPVLEDVINYYIANGNSLEGFNEIPDRTNITIDETNEAQCESIIRQAFKELGRPGDVNKYIQYFKDSGQLADVAKEELAALQEADKATKEELQRAAEEKAAKDEADEIKYWTDVKKVVESKKIAGYQIPDNIIIEREGKKISATPTDFFNYMYQVDDKGKSRYMYDLEKRDPKAHRDDQILRAYLTFVGGNYGSLVDMAIKDKEVKNIKLKSVKTTTKGIKITPPQSNKSTGKIDFGF